MAKVGLTVILVILTVWGVGVWRKNDKGVPRESSQEQETGDKKHQQAESEQYWIENLKKRDYSAGVIEKLPIHRKTSGFNSQVIIYESEGLKLRALLNIPNGKKPETGWPVVIVNHGYIPPEQYSTENSYINTSGYFANAGWAVLKPDYRGHDKSEGTAESLTDRLNYAVDVLNLLSGVTQIDGIDPKRIYMWGHSMGGDITLKVIEISDQIRAASLWAPAITGFPENALYFSRRTQTERYQKFKTEFDRIFADGSGNKASSFENVHRVQIPVNIQHGTADESVPYEWGVALRDRMVSAARTINFYSYEGDNHDIANNWSTALNRDVKLFELTL